MLRRMSRSALPLRLKMSWPLNRTVPAVGRSSAMSNRPSVDLPQPDSPTTPRVSPLRRSKLTPSTARTAPTCFLNRMPRVRGKCLTRSRTSSTGSAPGLAAARLDGLVIDQLLPEVARAGAVRGDVVQRWFVRATHVTRIRAARVERAAWRDPGQDRGQALDRVQLLALAVDARDRVQQPFGVGVG